MAKEKQKPEKSLTVRQPQARRQSLPSRFDDIFGQPFLTYVGGEVSSAMRRCGRPPYMFWKRKISLSQKSSYQGCMRRM